MRVYTWTNEKWLFTGTCVSLFSGALLFTARQVARASASLICVARASWTTRPALASRCLFKSQPLGGRSTEGTSCTFVREAPPSQRRRPISVLARNHRLRHVLCTQSGYSAAVHNTVWATYSWCGVVRPDRATTARYYRTNSGIGVSGRAVWRSSGGVDTCLRTGPASSFLQPSSVQCSREACHVTSRWLSLVNMIFILKLPVV